MKWFNLGNNVGYLKKILSCPDFANADQFLWRTIEKYAQFNSSYYRTQRLDDFPFAYGELQNQPILFLCMSKTSDGQVLPFAEVSYERRRYKRPPKKCRMDFWVMYR